MNSFVRHLIIQLLIIVIGLGIVQAGMDICLSGQTHCGAPPATFCPDMAMDSGHDSSMGKGRYVLPADGAQAGICLGIPIHQDFVVGATSSQLDSLAVIADFTVSRQNNSCYQLPQTRANLSPLPPSSAVYIINCSFLI